MAFWELVQQNSEALLADGANRLLVSELVSNPEDLSTNQGVVLQLRDEEYFFCTDAQNIRKCAISVSDERHSRWYKALKRTVGTQIPALSEFDLQAIEIGIARRELSEFITNNLPAVISRARRGRADGGSDDATALWRRAELVGKALIAEGGQICLNARPQRWGGPCSVSGPGILMLWDRHEEVVFVDAARNLAETYLVHARRTPDSLVRRHVGERFLGLTLKQGNKGDFYFSASEELEVSSFLKSCRVAFIPVRFGREEVAHDLVERLRPQLNDFTGNRPFERRREFHRPLHRKHFIWG